MNGILQDFRYGFRMLKKNPGFTWIAIVILALGIGANSAIFSIVHAVLLKDLPYTDPETLVVVWGTEKSGILNLRNQVSATDIADYRAQNKSFDEISTFTGWRPIISGAGNGVERVPAMQVGDGYFKALKAEPVLGRVFRPEEQNEGKDFVVVLSHGLWQRKFGSDPNIIGKTVKLNLRVYTIVGVLKPEVHSLPTTLIDSKAELYRPVAEPYDQTQRGARHLRAIGRLKKGVSISEAQAEMNAIASRLEKQYPDDNTARGINVVNISEDTVGNLRTSLFLLTGAAGLVLLIACANLANLLLARAATRHREIAVRTSLGAPRWRLVRQLLAESAFLTVAGGICGILLAYWGMDAIKNVGAEIIPQIENTQLNSQVITFTVVTSLIAGLLFGLAPAFQISRFDLTEALKEGGRGGTSGRFQGRMRNTLVGAEVALALLLLAGAGLLIQSVARLYQVDPGFKTSNVLTMNVWLPGFKYEEELKRTKFFHRMIERMERLPGVVAAGTTTVLPLSSAFDGRTIAVDGQPRAAADQPSADMYVVTPRYTEAMQIPLVAGRYLTMNDSETAPLAVLVSESMSKQLWKDQNPIGKRIRLYHGPGPDEETPWRTVVGLVRDVKQYGLDTDSPMQFYIPQAQFHAIYVTLVIRYSDRNMVDSLIRNVRKEILSLDPELPVFKIATLEEVLKESIAVRRLSMMLFGGFALLALCLAMAGIYGVVSYLTARRTQEIGIRMTLGAQKKDVIQLVLNQGMLPAIVGAAAGLAGAIGFSRLMTKLLYEVRPGDPLTLVVVTMAILAVTALACYIPAVRASKVDPLVSLRYE
ncbi:ABC transporter permease [bacterium]|nr:ABC transporter permease [bacterium]